MEEENNGFIDVIKRHWILISIIILMVLFGIVFLLSKGNKSLVKPAPYPTPNSQEPLVVSISPPIVQAVQTDQAEALRAAVDEAKQASTQYDANTAQLHTDFPWLRKLPFTNGVYYVYFDLEKKVFVGKIYPRQGDNIEILKQTIISDLNTKLQIPATSYPFEWIITPQ